MKNKQQAPGGARGEIDRGTIFTAWEQNMPGVMGEMLAQQINDLIDETSVPSVMEGVKVAVANNKRFFRYVRGVAVRHANGEGAPTRASVQATKDGLHDFPTYAAYKEAIQKDPSLGGRCSVRGTKV